MGALLQALEIIFEVQAKRSNEEVVRRKKSFSTHKMCFFPFISSVWTPPTFKASDFFQFLFILNNSKCYWSATFSSTIIFEL